MIDHFATRVSATHTRTRIPTVLIEAGQVTLTVAIDDALSLAAIRVRIADERWYARALSHTVDRGANGIFATW